MTKRNITLTLNIPDELASAVVHNLDVLKNNERLTEFLGEVVLEKLQDAEAIEALNQKVKLNGHGLMSTTEMYYNTLLERLKTLEQQIDALRYDMHTAAVLADKALYKEVSSTIMSNIDVLFRNLTLDIKLSISDFVEQRKWLEKEQALQTKFQSSLSNFRLLQAAFDDTTDVVLSPEDTLQTEETQTTAEPAPVVVDDTAVQEKLDTLLKEMEDIKYVLRNSSVIDNATIKRNIEFSGTEVETTIQSAQPAEQPVPQSAPVTQSAPATQSAPVPQSAPVTTISEAGLVDDAAGLPDLASLDFDAFSDFFG